VLEQVRQLPLGLPKVHELDRRINVVPDIA
jgi:hypothetical protein